MRVLSWNLFGLESDRLDERTEAALFRMLLGATPEQVLLSGAAPEPPEVLLLQEVVERTYFAHLRPHLAAAGYQLFPEQPPARNYFEVIAVRGLAVQRARMRRFTRTGQGRHLLRVDVEHRGASLALFTAHLESLKPSGPIRVEQAHEVFDALLSCERAVFGGDTNLRRGEVVLPEPLIDAFEAQGSPTEHRATWGNARYDRFWLVGVEPSSFTTFGGELLDFGQPASDHLGISLEVAAP